MAQKRKKINLGTNIKVPHGCTAIKGTLYIQPNGDQFFEASANSLQSFQATKRNYHHFTFEYVKHYVYPHRHVFYVSMPKDDDVLVGSMLPREIVRFCAAAATHKVKYYVPNDEVEE